MPNVEQWPYGDSRHIIRTSHQPCEWCHQRFSGRGYQWQLNQKRFCDNLCLEQKRENDFSSAKRYCADCHQFKVAAVFSYKDRGKFKRQRLTYCKYCEQKNTKHSWAHGPPRVTTAACKVCNAPIVARGNPSKINKRVVCSQECAFKNARRESVECGLCQKTLPYSAFERNKNFCLRPYCKKCASKELTIERGFLGLRPTYHVLMKHLRAHAKRHNKPFDLSIREGRKLWNQDCELCGAKVSKFVHTQRGEKIDKNTVRAMCRACALLDKAFPLGTAGLIEQACRIAKHRGAAADEPENQGSAG